MPLTRSAWLVLAALLLLASPTPATTVVRQSIETLTDRAEIVVRGIVEGAEGHAEVSGEPFRLARVRVVETLAGRAPTMLAIRLPGGAGMNGRACFIAGVPDLVAGDEVLLFLTRVPLATTRRATTPASEEFAGRRGRVAPATGPPPIEQWLPISLALGAYRVQRGEGGAVAVQDPQARGMAVAGAAPAEGDASATIALDDLAARVKARRGQQGRP